MNKESLALLDMVEENYRVLTGEILKYLSQSFVVPEDSASLLSVVNAMQDVMTLVDKLKK